MESIFVCYPLCGGKTRVKLLPETVLQNYPLFCPKCKQEVIISAEHLQVSVMKEEREFIQTVVTKKYYY